MTTITEAVTEAPDGAPGTLAAQRDALLSRLVLGDVGGTEWPTDRRFWECWLVLAGYIRR